MDAVSIEVWNKDASMPMTVPVIVVPNTHAEVVDANIRRNSRLEVPWFMSSEPHDGVAILCGGGPSLRDSIEELADIYRRRAGTFFGMNGASLLLSEHGLRPHYQVIIDAQEITSTLVDTRAKRRVYASHVHPETAKYADEFFHLNFNGVEELLPPEKVEAGGYTLVGGGVSVGITALVLAYAMGFRTLHVYGYDSSNRTGATHAYPQPHNAAIPAMEVRWGGQSYTASMPMKLQAEAFQRFASQLKDEGCTISVHGEGLLPAMWREPPTTEREKYQLLWSLGDYRRRSFGEENVQTFVEVAKPAGKIIDFGCGTGRAALRLDEMGYDVLLVDFTDNCRDKEAVRLAFARRDLTQPLGLKGSVGYCADVMEHIPPEDVDTVIANIMAAVPAAFFQIATVPDAFGATIGQTLHLTVRPHEWWRERFAAYAIEWQEERETHSSFFVRGATLA